MRVRSPGALSSALAVGAVLLTVGTAVTSRAAGAASVNSCANPILATDVAGWGTLNDEPFTRAAVTDHPVAKWEFSVANRATSTAGIYLPEVDVQPGQAWTFSVDTRTSNDPAGARIEVDWYTSTDLFLGHGDGDYGSVSGQRGYTHIAGTFTAPPTAGRAHVLVQVTDLISDSGFATTMCDYRPGGTDPQPTPSAPTVPPGSEGTTAAATFGWGRPTSGDEFDDSRTPLADTWNRQEGEPDGCYAGHDQKGLRCTANITENDGMVTVVGQPNGTTGLMQSRHTSYRGRWETRMRVDPTGVRDSEYHPVLLLWPAAEDFPQGGGEIDYSESESSSAHVSFFLHYGAGSNSQVGDVPGNGRQNLNLTDWHNYAVQWGRTCIRGFIDGVKWFEDCNQSHQPPRAMKQAIQLDYFPAAGGSHISGDVRMNVDWTRFYPAP